MDINFKIATRYQLKFGHDDRTSKNAFGLRPINSEYCLRCSGTRTEENPMKIWAYYEVKLQPYEGGMKTSLEPIPKEKLLCKACAGINDKANDKVDKITQTDETPPDNPLDKLSKIAPTPTNPEALATPSGPIMMTQTEDTLLDNPLDKLSKIAPAPTNPVAIAAPSKPIRLTKGNKGGRTKGSRNKKSLRVAISEFMEKQNKPAEINNRINSPQILSTIEVADYEPLVTIAPTVSKTNTRPNSSALETQSALDAIVNSITDNDFYTVLNE